MRRSRMKIGRRAGFAAAALVGTGDKRAPPRRPSTDNLTSGEPLMANIGPTELIIVLVIALLVLGPKRLPAAGRSLGDGIREFKESLSGRDRSDDAALPVANDAEEAPAESSQQT
jgi:sec-independent protein translocase protein TatA